MTLAGEASIADSDTESTVNNLEGVITILMVHYNHKYRDSDRVAEMMTPWLYSLSVPQSSLGCEDTSENHHILSTSIILFAVAGVCFWKMEMVFLFTTQF